MSNPPVTCTEREPAISDQLWNEEHQSLTFNTNLSKRIFSAVYLSLPKSKSSPLSLGTVHLCYAQGNILVVFALFPWGQFLRSKHCFCFFFWVILSAHFTTVLIIPYNNFVILKNKARTQMSVSINVWNN